MYRQELGRQGEDIAANILEKKGYSLVEKNYRCVLGEIDIIAIKDGYLIFIEVKTRKNLLYGLPQESITEKKKMRIRQIASCYLKQHNKTNVNCRFDVFSIIVSADCYYIDIIEDAF